MKLTVLGSSSAGNGYLLHNDTECLVIEAGIPYSTVKQAIKYKTNIISGLILTHEHGDHAKHVLQYAEQGINCYSSSGTFHALKSGSHRYRALRNLEKKPIGNFIVTPFDIKHDCAEPFGYVIYHPECGNVLFLTDTHYSEYTFDNLNHIIIEANYSEEILNEKVYRGDTHGFLRNRVVQSHMSIETAIQSLQANDLTKVNTVVLIHLSDSNSDAEGFRLQVQQQVGKSTYIAQKGCTIPLNKLPF